MALNVLSQRPEVTFGYLCRFEVGRTITESHQGWELLRSKLRIEPETDLGLYLGCLLSKGTNRLHDGTEVTTMTYNMEGLLKLSVEKYLDIDATQQSNQYTNC